MAEIIPAIYENGSFKPLQKVNLPERKHVHLMLMPDEDAALLDSQKEKETRF